MPADSHVLSNVSMFSMFSEPKNNTGLRFRSLAILETCFIGESFCFPVANQ